MKKILQVMTILTMSFIMLLSTALFVHAEPDFSPIDTLESVGIVVDVGSGFSRNSTNTVPNVRLAANSLQSADETLLVALLDTLDNHRNMGLIATNIDGSLIDALEAQGLWVEFVSMYINRNSAASVQTFQGIQPSNLWNPTIAAFGAQRYTPVNFNFPMTLSWTASHNQDWWAGGNVLLRLRNQMLTHQPVWHQVSLHSSFSHGFIAFHAPYPSSLFMENSNNFPFSVSMTLNITH